jgi:hypothetical protein
VASNAALPNRVGIVDAHGKAHPCRGPQMKAG